MLFIVLFAVLLPISNAQKPLSDYSVFQARYLDKVDLSAITTCHTLGGQKIDQVQPDNPDKGYKCKVNLVGVTDTAQQAKEYCESRIPFYIIKSKEGSPTECTFQINLKCAAEYWQVRGKCYKVSDVKYTWEGAQKICNVAGVTNPRVAEFYDEGLHNYFKDILKVYDAWVYVPELKDYYKNGKGNAAVYVNQGAYKFDARPGDILMDDPSAKHQVMCEYTPEMTMAELFYIGEIYSEIYPMTVFHSGAIIPSANLETIEHTGYKGDIPQFMTRNLKHKCLSIGKILNVDSYPITPIEGEYNDVKDYLKDQRFYLTNAFKNDGNERSNYRHPDQNDKEFPLDEPKSDTTNVSRAHSYSISQSGRYPTMASMRAPIVCTLHTFHWKYGPCPKEPEWSEQPVTFTRESGQVVCHYINNKHAVSLMEARALCEADGLGAALSGFDSGEEFKLVSNKTKLIENAKRKDGGGSYRVFHHYWLGGVSPCEVNCRANDLASWNKGVALNTSFLNDYKHEGFPWIKRSYPQFTAFRSNNDAFHIHGVHDFSFMLSICGKSAPLVRGDRIDSKVKG